MAVITDRYQLVIETGQAERALGNIGTAVRGFVAAIAVDKVVDFGRALVDASSEIQNVRNRLSLVTADAAELDSTMARLTTTAQANRASFAETANLYTSLSVATESLGYNQEQVLAITTRFQQALAVSGADANTAAGAIRQFAQAMGSGTVRGDEFNSIVEALGPALAIMARESGLTVGQLREMSQAGDLTAEAFAQMLMNSTALQGAFQGMTTTTEQLEQQFRDAFTYALAEMDRLVGVSNAYRESLFGLTRLLDYWSSRPGALVNIADTEIFEMAKAGAISYNDALREIEERIEGFGLYHVWTNDEDLLRLQAMRDTLRQMKEDADRAAQDAVSAGENLGENVAAPVNQAAEELDRAGQRLNTVLDNFAQDAARRIADQRNELELASLSGVEQSVLRIRQEEERRLDVMIQQIRASDLTVDKQDEQIKRIREITSETIRSRQEIERQTASVTEAMREQQETLRLQQDRTRNTVRSAQEEFVTGWSSAYDQYNRITTDGVNRATTTFRQGNISMLNSIQEFVRTGTFSVNNFINDIGQQLRGSLVNNLAGVIGNAINVPQRTTGGGVGGFFNNVMSDFLGGLFPRRALGGPVLAGSGYIVGESGREMFFPGTSGTIVPMDSGAGMNINFNIQAVDTNGFDQLLNRRRGDIIALVKQAMNETRGFR